MSVQFNERAPHPLRIDKSDSNCNLLDWLGSVLKTHPSSLDAQPLDCLRRCFSGFTAKGSTELSNAQTRRIGQSLNRQGFSKVLPSEIEGYTDTIGLWLHL